MTRWVKSSLCEHRELCSDHPMPQLVACVCTPNMGTQRQVDPRSDLGEFWLQRDIPSQKIVWKVRGKSRPEINYCSSQLPQAQMHPRAHRCISHIQRWSKIKQKRAWSAWGQTTQILLISLLIKINILLPHIPVFLCLSISKASSTCFGITIWNFWDTQETIKYPWFILWQKVYRLILQKLRNISALVILSYEP